MAAADVFSKEGPSATTEAVAKAAGVGIGTVFRHFPTKASLLEALVAERLEAVAQDAETLERAAAAGQAKEGHFFALLERMIEEGPTKRMLVDALSAEGIDVRTAFAGAGFAERVRRAVGRLLLRAQKNGEVRNDLDGHELFAVLAGAAATGAYLKGDRSRAKRALRVVLDGLKPPR